MSEESFTSFLCGNCQTELEATQDMIGEETECPACGARLIVPAPLKADDEDGVVRHSEGDLGKATTKAYKSRTIRIELGDLGL
jgi:DNA-directed RNA polymerase subunit RPC12/RpoP